MKNDLIKKIRKAYELSIREFADLIGVSGGSVSNWENNYRNPKAINVRKLMELAKEKNFEVKFEDFFS